MRVKQKVTYLNDQETYNKIKRDTVLAIGEDNIIKKYTGKRRGDNINNIAGRQCKFKVRTVRFTKDVMPKVRKKLNKYGCTAFIDYKDGELYLKVVRCN